MELLTTREFNGVALACYKAENESDGFWVTREQVGQMLEYKYPGIAIGKIHNRNKDRLDKYSRVNQIDLPFGGTQTVTLYNFKGFLEICRFSKQPKANAVIDFAWSVMDEIRRTGKYEAVKIPAINVYAANALHRLMSYIDNPEDKKFLTNYAAKLITGQDLRQPVTVIEQYTIEDIARQLDWEVEALKVRADALHIKHSADWILTKSKRQELIDLIRQDVVQIKDGYEYYADGRRRIHWEYDGSKYASGI